MNEEVANQALQRIIEKLEPLVEKGITQRECGRELATMILEEIQSALTSRTERCAKIAENQEGKNCPTAINIRALNQLEQKQDVVQEKR